MKSRRRPPRIVVLGAINADFFIRTDRFPEPGETVQGDTFLAAAGGKGANQAVAAARLGARVRLISCVGGDSRGRELVAGLKREGVDTQFVKETRHAQTGAALIIVDASGEKSIVAAPGANHALKVSDACAAREAISSAAIFLTQFEAPMKVILAASKIAERSKVKIVLDPAPATTDVPDELLKRVYAIRPNSHEAEALTGVRVRDRRSAAKSGRMLQQRGVRIVAVQAGDEGNLLLWEDREIWLPKIKVPTVDATGAGDAFAAALAVAIAEEQAPEWAGRFCNAAAALTTTKLGAQPALPDRREVEELARSSR